MLHCFPSFSLTSFPTLLTSQTLQIYACNQASHYRDLSSMMLRSLNQVRSYNLGRQSFKLFESWPMVESSSSVHSLAHPQGQCPAYPTWHSGPPVPTNWICTLPPVTHVPHCGLISLNSTPISRKYIAKIKIVLRSFRVSPHQACITFVHMLAKNV